MILQIFNEFKILTPRQMFGQALFYLSIILIVAFLSTSPHYVLTTSDQAELKLAIRHSGTLLGECHRLNDEELQKLSPNMQQPLVCPREKSPLDYRLSVNGTLVSEGILVPSGIHNDGVIATFHQVKIPIGKHEVELQIRDDQRMEAYNHRFKTTLEALDRDSILLEFNDAGFRLSQRGKQTLI